MEILTPIKAIRAKCVDCSGGQLGEVRLCPVTTCALWPYRMGKRPTDVDHERYDRQEVSSYA
jgi:hypothetical protein